MVLRLRQHNIGYKQTVIKIDIYIYIYIY